MLYLMIEKILGFWEKQAFGVCTWWGEKLKVSSHNIRLAFIYLSFITFGSPLFIYLVMAWVLKHKDYFFLRKRSTIWEL